MTTAIYSHPDCIKHEMGKHHECPERILAIQAKLKETGTDQKVVFREAPKATYTDVARAHLADMVLEAQNNIPNEGEYYPLGETMMNAHSFSAALHAAGAVIDATRAVLDGEIKNAFCLVRPIGHHSTPSEAMGFSVFNSVAIGALWALRVRNISRVAIVDIDVHHGNGTEEIFAYEPRVLMVSYFQEYLYPFCGNEKKRAHMVNVPVPPKSDGKIVRPIVTEQWLPALRAHKPEIIYMSAGFDAHRDDPLGEMNLVEEDYVWITRQIMDVAEELTGGKLVSSLEGGYNLEALANSATAHIRTLAGLD